MTALFLSCCCLVQRICVSLLRCIKRLVEIAFMLGLSWIDKRTILVLRSITSHLLCHAWLRGLRHLVCRPSCSYSSTPWLMGCFRNRAFTISCIEVLASEHVLLLRGFYKARHLTTGSEIRFHAISKRIYSFSSMG